MKTVEIKCDACGGDLTGAGMKSQIASFEHLAGAIRCGDYHQDWLRKIERQGLLRRG